MAYKYPEYGTRAWEERWQGWRAVIRPTLYGTFGIYWQHAPAMQRRGGYSGPYPTRDEAESGARKWAAHFDVTDLAVIHEQEASDGNDQD